MSASPSKQRLLDVLKVVRDGRPGFFKQWASRYAKHGVWRTDADTAQVLVNLYGGVGTLQVLASSGLKKIYIDDLASVVGAKRAARIAGLIDLKGGRVKTQPLQKLGATLGFIGLAFSPAAALWRMLAARIPVVDTAHANALPSPEAFDKTDSLVGLLLLAFLSPIFLSLLFGAAALKLRIQSDDGWRSRWRGCVMAAKVSAACLPFLLATGLAGHQNVLAEDARAATVKAQEAAHDAALRAADAAKSPAQRFQECQDEGHSINQCRTVYGSRENYVAWMRQHGYGEDLVQYMANAPVERSIMAEKMNECASGGSCDGLFN